MQHDITLIYPPVIHRKGRVILTYPQSYPQAYPQGKVKNSPFWSKLEFIRGITFWTCRNTGTPRLFRNTNAGGLSTPVYDAPSDDRESTTDAITV